MRMVSQGRGVRGPPEGTAFGQGRRDGVALISGA